MKIKNFLLILMLCAPMAWCAQPSQNKRERFLQAHELYQQGQYQEALARYQEFTDKSSAVWYNMGNCAYQLGDYMHALLYFKRAEREATPHEYPHIVHNISMTHQQLGLPSVSNNVSFFDAVRVQVRTVPLLLMQLLLLVLWFAALGALWLLSHNRFKKIIIGLLIVAWSILALVCWRKYHDEQAEYALVMNDKSTLFVAPNAAYHAVGELPKGVAVKVDEKRKGWYKVQANSKKGWMRQEDVEQF